MRSTGLACVLLSCAAVAGAQTPPPVKAEAVPKPPDAAAASTAPDVTFSYDPAGRRDPFVSLMAGGFESSGGKRPDGSTGLSVTEISVRGIMQSHGALVAMVQGPDNKTYVMHAGDKLIDGTIKAITPQGLVIVQEVNDPLSLVKQREIRKLLRSFEDGKQ